MSDTTVSTEESELPAFEQARDELTDIVRQLETGSASLDQCLALWERGQFLATVCQTHLDSALQRVQQANEQPTTVQPATEQPNPEQPNSEQPNTEQPTDIEPTT